MRIASAPAATASSRAATRPWFRPLSRWRIGRAPSSSASARTASSGVITRTSSIRLAATAAAIVRAGQAEGQLEPLLGVEDGAEPGLRARRASRPG